MNPNFAKLRRRFHGDNDKATTVVLRMYGFLDKEIRDGSGWNMSLEPIRNAIRTARYDEAISLSQDIYERVYRPGHPRDPESLMELVITRMMIPE
jgi:hypothetical protein